MRPPGASIGANLKGSRIPDSMQVCDTACPAGHSAVDPCSAPLYDAPADAYLAEFTEEMHNYYNVDMSCLSESYRKEQRDYYLRTAQWVDVHPSQLVGTPVPFASMDLLKTTVEELKVLAMPPGAGWGSPGGVVAVRSAWLAAWHHLPLRPHSCSVVPRLAAGGWGCNLWSALARQPPGRAPPGGPVLSPNPRAPADLLS